MITIKIGSLIAAKPVLQELANTKMTAKQSFQVLRILKIIDVEYANIEQAQKKLFENHAQRDENGNLVLNEDGTGYIVPNENRMAFMKEMDEFTSGEINLECEQFAMELLDNMILTPNQLMAIESFIKE